MAERQDRIWIIAFGKKVGLEERGYITVIKCLEVERSFEH